jgi:hypothetical protein
MKVADVSDEQITALAGAFALLHGSPPKGLKWREGGFGKRDSMARGYCWVLENYLRQTFPSLDDKPRNVVVLRNKVLREIFVWSAARRN